jgi:hypothetical protein
MLIALQDKNMKNLTREQIQTILTQAPQEISTESILQGLVDRGYTLEGYNDKKEPSTLETAGKAIGDVAGTVIEGGKRALKTANEVGQVLTGQKRTSDNFIENTKNLAKETAKGALATTGTIGKAGVETVAGVLNVADTATGKVASNAGKQILQGIASTEAGKNALEAINGGVEMWENYKAQNPEDAQVYEDIFNTLNIGAVKKTVNVAKQGAELTGKGARIVADKVVETAPKVVEASKQALDKTRAVITGYQKAKTPEDVFSKVKTNLQEQIEGRKALNKPLDKTRTDIFDTIAKDPRYYPEIDAENKSFNTKLAVSNLNNDIAEIGEATKNLFKNADSIDGGVEIKSLTDNLQRNILNKDNAVRYVVGGQNVFSDIQPMIERAKQVYGEIIPREAIWEIRKSIDDAIEKLADTNIKKSIRQDLRKTFAQSLEDSIQGNKNLVKTAMSEMQKRIEARDYLQGALSEAKLQGGKLTDIIRNFAVSSMTSALTAGVGGVAGGFGGAIAGYAGSQALGKWLAKNILTSAGDRKILKQFVKERPQVLDDIEEYIKSVSKEEADNIKNNLLKAGIK